MKLVIVQRTTNILNFPKIGNRAPLHYSPPQTVGGIVNEHRSLEGKLQPKQDCNKRQENGDNNETWDIKSPKLAKVETTSTNNNDDKLWINTVHNMGKTISSNNKNEKLWINNVHNIGQGENYSPTTNNKTPNKITIFRPRTIKQTL